MLDTSIRRVGNSLGIIIPSFLLKMLDVDKGDKLKIDHEGNKIILTKVSKASKVSNISKETGIDDKN